MVASLSQCLINEGAVFLEGELIILHFLPPHKIIKMLDSN